MQDLSYRTLIWLSYRLAATFAVGLPLVLLIWSAMRKETSMIRLLTIYWKVASLFAISMLLLTDQRPIGYLTLFLSPLLMISSIWFWVDLNEELADLPPLRPLPLTVRLWRWVLSGVGLITSALVFPSLSCAQGAQEISCLAWVEAPKGINKIFENIFAFLFGGQWTETIAAFIGYLALLIYLVGLLQWLLIRLPRQGRIAGEF